MSHATKDVPLPKERAVPVPPRDARALGGSGTGLVVAATAIAFPAVLYFGFFGAILVDELVLETSWLHRNLPDPVVDFCEVIYMPLFLLCEAMGVHL